MMKKLLLLCSALFAINFAGKAQITVIDTLRYFELKQLYKLPVNTVHPTYKATAAVHSNTALTHVGSIFKNTGTITVTGLQSRVLRIPPSASLNGIPLRLYLCTVSNGLPVLPAIDSISGAAYTTDNAVPSQRQFGQRVGGNFTTPHVVSGDFAVLIKNASNADGDTIRFFRTAGHTATSTTAPNPAQKFGEGLGVIRDGGVFHKTTNYNSPAFGPGTDYEFCVEPIVTMDLYASQIESPTQQGACCWQVYTNTNTSTNPLRSHQFNFNEFFRAWQPFDPSTFPSSFTADSSFSWYLGDGSPLYYEAPGVDTVHLSFVANHCNQQYTGQMLAAYRQQSNILSTSYTTALTFTSYAVYCNGDTATSGIHELGSLANVKIYPNPTSDATVISGLQGKNSIALYSMTGQLIYVQLSERDTYFVDLVKQPRGIYFVKINNVSDNRTRTVKIVKE